MTHIWAIGVPHVWHGGEDDHEDEVDDGREEAADGAPPHGHRQHAVHAEHDELENREGAITR